MLFIRRGPLIIFFASENPNAFNQVLQENSSYQGCTSSISCASENSLNLKAILCEAMEKAGEADTIAIIHYPRKKDASLLSCVEHVLAIYDTPTNLLTYLINQGQTKSIQQVTPGPSMLVVRLPGDAQKIIDRIQEIYEADRTTVEGAIAEGTQKATMIFFSEQSIDRVLTRNDILEEVLVSSASPLSIYRDIRKNAIRYFAVGLDKSSWYELKINIYDANEQYKLHLERLYLVLTELEAGFALAEEWTSDQAFVLFAVPVYQVKVVSLIAPEQFKKILIGLEYGDRGERIVDMDLYYRNRKIERNHLKEMRQYKKEESGKICRQALLGKLSAKTSESLKQLESNIGLDIHSNREGSE